MLAKCSSPSCYTSFRHLGEGRLFRLESDNLPSATSHSRAENVGLPEYFWLCGECSATLTLTLNRNGDVILCAVPASARGDHYDASFISVNREQGLVLRSVTFRRRRTPERDEGVAGESQPARARRDRDEADRDCFTAGV